jgi:hypothetical protein
MDSGMKYKVFILCTLLLIKFANAAPDNDDPRKQALLRAYNTADAERRYAEFIRNPQAHVTATNTALGNLVGTLAARAQQQMDESNRIYYAMYDAVALDLEYPLKTTADVEAMKEMLLLNAKVDEQGYRYFARKRLIEYALQLRPRSEYFFKGINYEYAATELRKNAYFGGEDDGDWDFYPWSAFMLGKLYLTGNGVPLDEGEAYRLIDRCIMERSLKKDYDESPDKIRCLLTRAQMFKNGWGVLRDNELYERDVQYAIELYNNTTPAPWTGDKNEFIKLYL